MARARAAAVMLKTVSKALFDAEVEKIGQRLLSARSWRLVSKEYPILEVEFTSSPRPAMRIRMDCPNWNEEPPSIILLDQDANPLTSLPAGVSNIFNAGPHHKTGRPFICMIGSLEYHTHESHVSDLWGNYAGKTDYDLGSILTKIWKGWLNGAIS